MMLGHLVSFSSAEHSWPPGNNRPRSLQTPGESLGEYAENAESPPSLLVCLSRRLRKPLEALRANHTVGWRLRLLRILLQ